MHTYTRSWEHHARAEKQSRKKILDHLLHDSFLCLGLFAPFAALFLAALLGHGWWSMFCFSKEDSTTTALVYLFQLSKLRISFAVHLRGRISMCASSESVFGQTHAGISGLWMMFPRMNASTLLDSAVQTKCRLTVLQLRGESPRISQP